MKNFPQQKELTKSDYMIVCGDFGLIWDNSKQEKYWRDWLTDKNFTTLFVDGNHENFELLNQYPVEIWNGGKVHKITNSIIHLMRGQVFTIEGKKFFTFGGANSHDKERRTEHISWWKEEFPSYTEMNEGMDNIEDNDWKVDYIITHDCPSDILYVMDAEPRIYKCDHLNNYFNSIKHMVEYKHWYFGHYHYREQIDEEHTVLYRKIIQI